MKFTVKLGEPTTEEARQAQAEQKRQRCINNADFADTIAAKLDKGEALDDLEMAFAAGSLRSTAKRLRAVDTTPKGQLKKLPEEALMLYVSRVVLDGQSQNKAIEVIAEKYDVSTQSVKKLIGMVGPDKEKNSAKTEALAQWMAAFKPRSQD